MNVWLVQVVEIVEILVVAYEPFQDLQLLWYNCFDVTNREYRNEVTRS